MNDRKSTFLLTQKIDTGSGKNTFTQKIEVTEITKRDRYLKYDESMEEHLLNVILRIGDGFIKISRSGVINMKFTFVKDETTDTFYESPAGRHHFTIYTNDMSIEEDGIVIDYNLYEQNRLLGNYQYKLEREGQ